MDFALSGATSRHPDIPIEKLHAEQVKGFLNNLVIQRNVAASTQNQALNALVFLFREVPSWFTASEPSAYPWC
ncbi:MAG: phage integrase N-terminal SAM-like domain-containing protein [Chromatiales bacterium]|nr:phage integrase N-terminal SAM-like domain-containing protein [Chromatiales bacterium]